MLKKAFFVILAVSALLFFVRFFTDDSSPPNEEIALVDPEIAPLDVREKVLTGFRIFLETKKYAPKYTGDVIDCSNCHFSAGNTLGGKNGGISLVGSSHFYPKKLANGKTLTLVDRINGCFERSMNGKDLPADCEEMEGMIAYLKWISTPVKNIKNPSWLGLPDLKSPPSYIPNPKRGEELYHTHCAVCHGPEGKGQKRDEDLSYPPLWGDRSFNAGAGMCNPKIFSSFIYYNMPYKAACLKVKEAKDIAAFVTSRPRPARPAPK